MEIHHRGCHNWINQVYCSLVACLLTLTVGCVAGWPSSALSFLRQHGITQTQQTWMVSCSLLGACLGPTLFTLMIDRVGRKYSLLIADIIYIISWTTLGTAQGNADILCFGRFVGGLAIGYTINAVSIYISEIADVEIRQTLTCLTGPAISLGLLIQYGAGPWLPYNLIIFVSALPAVLFFFLWFQMKESPYYLVAKGRTEEATNVLIWLRGSNEVKEELTQIELLVDELKNNKGKKLDLFIKRGPRKALLLSGLMFFIQPFSGVDVLASYMEQIFADTTSSLSHQMATLVIGTVNTCCSLIEPAIVHRVGSKWTMVVCAFLCSVFLFTFGGYKYFDERGYDLKTVSFIPITCFILFSVFCALGYSSMPWAISAELFPPAHKAFGTNLVITMNCVLGFVLTSLYGYLTPLIGASYYFMGSAIIFMLGDFLVALVLPNTKGKSFEKIQNLLER